MIFSFFDKAKPRVIGRRKATGHPVPAAESLTLTPAQESRTAESEAEPVRYMESQTRFIYI